MTFDEVSQKSLKGYELLALRKHHNLEVRNLANMIANPLEKVEYIDLDDFLGIDEIKAFKLALLRVRHMTLGDVLTETEVKAN